MLMMKKPTDSFGYKTILNRIHSIMRNTYGRTKTMEAHKFLYYDAPALLAKPETRIREDLALAKFGSFIYSRPAPDYKTPPRKLELLIFNPMLLKFAETWPDTVYWGSCQTFIIHFCSIAMAEVLESIATHLHFAKSLMVLADMKWIQEGSLEVTLAVKSAWTESALKADDGYIVSTLLKMKPGIFKETMEDELVNTDLHVTFDVSFDYPKIKANVQESIADQQMDLKIPTQIPFDKLVHFEDAFKEVNRLLYQKEEVVKSEPQNGEDQFMMLSTSVKKREGHM